MSETIRTNKSDAKSSRPKLPVVLKIRAFRQIDSDYGVLNGVDREERSTTWKTEFEDKRYRVNVKASNPNSDHEAKNVLSDLSIPISKSMMGWIFASTFVIAFMLIGFNFFTPPTEVNLNLNPTSKESDVSNQSESIRDSKVKHATHFQEDSNTKPGKFPIESIDVQNETIDMDIRSNDEKTSQLPNKANMTSEGETQNSVNTKGSEKQFEKPESISLKSVHDRKNKSSSIEQETDLEVEIQGVSKAAKVIGG